MSFKLFANVSLRYWSPKTHKSASLAPGAQGPDFKNEDDCQAGSKKKQVFEESQKISAINVGNILQRQSLALLPISMTRAHSLMLPLIIIHFPAVLRKQFPTHSRLKYHTCIITTRVLLFQILALTMFSQHFKVMLADTATEAQIYHLNKSFVVISITIATPVLSCSSPVRYVTAC